VARTEISCHARGAFHLFSDVATIIDIGGQDSKAIRVGPGGRVLDFAMNDKCAAGTGRFLEVMAGALGISLPDMADLALASTVEITISSTCTVFAESEVVSLISQGRAPADIASAICRAIAQRTAGLAARVGISDRVVMTGGVAKNQAVVRMLADKLGFGISVPEEPQITGALGAALIARANSTS
jgi:predicted CoA-substrate-specific enzyme activase